MQNVYIIIGERGTGKTFFAEALANQIRHSTSQEQVVLVVEGNNIEALGEVEKSRRVDHLIFVCDHGFYATKRDVMAALKRASNERMPVVYTMNITREPIP